MYFRFFVIISPWKSGGALHLNKFESLHPRMLCAKFGWNSPIGSGEEDENVKSLRQQWQWQQNWRRRTMDKFWSVKLTWACGLGELKKVLSIFQGLKVLSKNYCRFMCKTVKDSHVLSSIQNEAISPNYT